MSIAEKLRGQRGLAARGRLSLDRDKAREKLRMFRLPDPHFYVLQFVRAASVLGATRIEFEISARQVRCTFDRELPSEHLSDLWGIALEERGDRHTVALHYLALGLGSAQALDPSLIEVSSDSALLRIEGAEESFDGDAPILEGTQILVREKLKFGHLIEFFSSIRGELAEVAALRARCGLGTMEVVVNGKSIATDVTTNKLFPVHFAGDTESGVVALDRTRFQGRCAILRDSVQIAIQAIDNHGLAASGFLESSRVGTDLSGLSLIGGDAAVGVVHGSFVPHYHESLRMWLASDEADLADKLNALSSLITYVDLLIQREFPVDLVTQQLLESLMNEPLFDDATQPPSEPMISLADARSLGPSPVWSYRVSSERVVGVTVPDGRRVLLVEDASSLGVDDDFQSVHPLKRAVMRAIGDSQSGSIQVVTTWLKRRREAARNREMWMSRPEHEPRSRVFQKTVTVAELRGEVFIPFADGAVTNPVITDECGFSIYPSRRLLRHTRDQEMFGVTIEGALEPLESHDGVVRDERLDRVAVALCAMMFDLHLEVAEALIADESDEASRPRVLDTFVLGLWTGTFCRGFMGSLGYEPSSALDTLLQSPELDSMRSLAWAPPVAEIIERLGPAAQVRSYELADGTPASLAELVQRTDLMLLNPQPQWRSFLARTRDDLGSEILSSIVVVDEIQGKILRRACAWAPDAVLEVPKLLSKKKFLEGPVYVDPTPSSAIEEVSEFDHPGGHVTVMLVPIAEPRVCEVQFVWHGRALARRSYSGGLAALRVIIESDELTPTEGFMDVEEDHVFSSLIAAMREDASSMLSQWWHRRAAANDVGAGAVLRQFVEVAFQLAEASPDEPVLPVSRWDGTSWRSSFESLEEIQSNAARHGFVVPITRGGEPQLDALPHRELPVLRLVGDTPLGDFRRLFGKQYQQIDCDVGNVRGLKAHESFLSRPWHPAALSGGTVTWEGRIGELDCRTALYTDPGVGTGRQSNRVEVLLDGRLLERVDVEIPMGQFRSVISGAGLLADPTYRFVSGGRGELLSAAAKSAATTIREACRRVSVAGGPIHELASILPDLRRFLANCRDAEPEPPFDLAALLESTPLFQLLDGTWLSFRQLSTIARGGILQHAEYGDHPGVLWLTAKELPLVERVLGPKFGLEKAAGVFDIEPYESITGSGLSDGLAAPPISVREQFSEDPLLADIIDILIEARGPRLDLFDDHFARSFVWAQLPEDALCRVTDAQVEIDDRHALVERVRKQGDHGARAFLASAVYSAINAYYQQITDHDELELQARLVRGMRR